MKLTLKKIWHTNTLLKAILAKWRFGAPGNSLQIYAITGTDGKTTSTTMLYHILKESGYKVALISTVAAFIGDEEIDTGFHVTSPEPWQLQKLLQRCVEAGIEHVVLEVTSHGIFQYRIWGVPIMYAGLTNVTHEHLDYFGTLKAVVQVKSALLQQAKKAFINRDDTSFSQVKKLLETTQTPYDTYTQTPPAGKIGTAITTQFAETYNQANAHLVWKMAQAIGITEDQFVKAVKTFPGVKGRMQHIPNPRGLEIIVDFAHTPNGLENILHALRSRTTGKLIAVHGSAGLRDRTKRPLMGRISSEIADLAIFTAEDPRTEKVETIIRQMKEGVSEPNHRKVVTIVDRREAIRFALEQAKPGDTIGIFGKGHERSMCFGTTEIPWSDQEVVTELLAENNSLG